MELAAKIGNMSETLLLTPRGKVTLIEKKDLIQLDLRPFDRIAFHKSNMIIHEATVLQVNAATFEILVIHRTKDGGPISKGIVEVHKINLKSDNRQLYRYDDRPTEADMPDILKRVLEYNGTEGYNILSYNCQHLASSIRYGNENSHQTWWMILKIVVDCGSHIGIPLFSEKFENDNGGKDILGAKASACLHLGLLVAECVVAFIKLFRGRMSWKDFINVMTRQLPMHLFGLVGNCIQPILQKLATKFLSQTAMVAFGKVAPSCVVSLVFGFCGFLVADTILPGRASCGYYKYVRKALIFAASVGSFFAGFAVSGWLLQSCVAIIGGVFMSFVGHFLSHDKYISWLDVEGRWIQDLADLNPGDHITTYWNRFHQCCHAIFLRASGNNMVVIRNTKHKGVIQEELKFEKDWVYHYNHPPSEVRSAQEVVAVAKSKIGEEYRNNYSCRSFAYSCKRKDTGSGVSNAVSVDSAFDSILRDESLSEEQRSRLMYKFEELKSQMSDFDTEDDGTTQDLPRQSGSQQNELELEHEASAPPDHKSLVSRALVHRKTRFALA